MNQTVFAKREGLRLTLFVVGTPIGHLQDMTARAIATLKQVDAIIAEDTRSYQVLAGCYGIPAKPVYSLYRGNESGRVEQLLPKLREGLNAALVSESGTPGVSDPGALLVRQCLENAVPVVPVPGPSALTAALSAAGVFAGHVLFLGFLPKKKPAEPVLRALKQGDAAVFYENAGRLAATLAAIASDAPQSRVIITRELTKIHEEIWAGDAVRAAADWKERNIKGEVTVVVEPAPRDDSPDEQNNTAMDGARKAIGCMKSCGVPMSDAVRKAAQAFGVSRKELYAEELEGSGP